MFVTDGLGVPTELAVTVESTWDTTPGKGLYVVIVGGVDVVEVSRFGGLYITSKHQLMNMKLSAFDKRTTYSGLDIGLSAVSCRREDGNC